MFPDIPPYVPSIPRVLEDSRLIQGSRTQCEYPLRPTSNRERAANDEQSPRKGVLRYSASPASSPRCSTPTHTRHTSHQPSSTLYTPNPPLTTTTGEHPQEERPHQVHPSLNPRTPPSSNGINWKNASNVRRSSYRRRLGVRRSGRTVRRRERRV